MTLFSLVAAHTTVDLETVAQLSTGTHGVIAAVPASDALQGAVVLSTCNRLEIYAESVDEAHLAEAQDDVLNGLALGCGSTFAGAESIRSAFHFYRADAAVRHLFEVGAGLKSAVVGEREIAGQVRRALSQAQEAGTTTGSLTKLFETATHTAKDVGARTALGSTGRSIVSVALDLATEVRAGTSPVAARRFWEDSNILLVGTGAYAGTTLAQLQQLGAQNVAVHSASGRAERFVADRGGWAMALGGDQVTGAFGEADVLIGCSGGDRTLSAESFAALREGAERRVTVLDLALTHDFDPEMADLPGVDFITLESVKMAAPDEQNAAVVQARHLVDTAVTNFLSDRRARSANDAIVTLRQHTNQVLESEVERIRARHGCTAAAEEVELAMRRMVRQLLHEPTVRARAMAEQGRLAEYEDALETLYGLDVVEATEQRKAAKEDKKAKKKAMQAKKSAQSEAPEAKKSAASSEASFCPVHQIVHSDDGDAVESA